MAAFYRIRFSSQVNSPSSVYRRQTELLSYANFPIPNFDKS